MNVPGTTNVELISGWKSIAAYLGKGVRTVQRYERKFHLPVRRPAGIIKGPVLARADDLDAWVRTTPLRHSWEASNQIASSNLAGQVLKERIRAGWSLCDQGKQLLIEFRAARKRLLTSVGALRCHGKTSARGNLSHLMASDR